MSFAYKAHEQSGLLLNSNESSLAPDARIMKEFARLLEQSALNRYPEDTSALLKNAYADVMHLAPDQILVTNGSDASLQILITALCRQGKSLVMLDPDFGMYRFYSHCVAAPVFTYQTAWDGSFRPDLLASYAWENRAGLMLLSNPNNPTGHLLTREEVCELARRLYPIVLAMDEAYMDFDDQSALELIDSTPNLVVTRTLSKAWGAAGIRVGFLISQASLIARLADYRIVYSVSTLDQLAARAVLAYPDAAAENIQRVRGERARLQQALAAFPELKTGPFHGNFYSILWPGKMKELEAAFEQAGITIRTYGDLSRVRITIGLPEENDRVLAVLESLKGGAQDA